MKKHFLLISFLVLLSSIPLLSSNAHSNERSFAVDHTTISIPANDLATLTAEPTQVFQLRGQDAKGILVDRISAPENLLASQVIPCSFFVLSRSWQRSVATRAPPAA